MKERNRVKKNWVLRISSIALMFTLISTCLLSGTLAKYVTAYSGYDTARVAKFDFKAAGLDTTSKQINIFDTIYSNGVADTVISSNTDKVVAPGTAGAVDFEFTGQSEVTTKISFSLTEENDGNVPLVYEYGGKYYSDKMASGPAYLKLSTTTANATAFTAVTIETGGIDALATALTAATTTVIPPNTSYAGSDTSVKWYWAFEQEETSGAGDIDTRDVTDTALGQAGTDTVRLNVKVTAEQVD